jgi:hypothetical protein
MPITEEIVAAFLKCETKAHLQYSGILGAQSEFSQRAQNQREEYRESCRELLCSALHTPSFVGTPDLQSLKDRRYHLVLDYVVAQSEIDVRLDALVLNRVKRARLDCPYIPVRFVPCEKLSTDDKLMLAFNAVALSKVYGKTPRAGRIIHGRNHTMANIALFPLLGKPQQQRRTHDVVVSGNAEDGAPNPSGMFRRSDIGLAGCPNTTVLDTTVEKTGGSQP